jgi:ankyrin repeat protein
MQVHNTLLMRAACYGHTEAVRFLIESGADLNIRAANGRTALSGIRHAAHPEGAIAELRKAGAAE